MRPYATIAAILMLALLAQTGCTEQSSAPRVPNFPPISGTVVDADTGEPIEGAAVIATWVAAAGIGGGSYEGMNEDLTNYAGVFNINGTMYGGTDFNFAIYKYGYLAWSHNTRMINSDGKRELVPGFEWKSGQTYRLEKFPPTWSHLNHTRFIEESVGHVPSPLIWKMMQPEEKFAAEERRARDAERLRRMHEGNAK